MTTASPTTSRQGRSCCQPIQSRSAGSNSAAVITTAIAVVYWTEANRPSPVAASAITTAPAPSHRHATSAPTTTSAATASCTGIATSGPTTVPGGLAGTPTVSVMTASTSATTAAPACASVRLVTSRTES